jgi:hypothetical protein
MSSFSGSSGLLLGELLAGASSCLLPWDGARASMRERDEERRENHQIQEC